LSAKGSTIKSSCPADVILNAEKDNFLKGNSEVQKRVEARGESCEEFPACAMLGDKRKKKKCLKGKKDGYQTQRAKTGLTRRASGGRKNKPRAELEGFHEKDRTAPEPRKKEVALYEKNVCRQRKGLERDRESFGKAPSGKHRQKRMHTSAGERKGIALGNLRGPLSGK